MTPSQRIDKKIADLPDWRGQAMANVRRLVREAVPDVTEEWKWMGTPTWSHGGILCICNAFKDMVKVTFIRGAHLPDPDGVFNAELEGNQWRAIKLFEGDALNAVGFKKLLRAAVAFNGQKGKARAATGDGGPTRKKAAAAKPKTAPAAEAKAARPKARAQTVEPAEKPRMAAAAKTAATKKETAATKKTAPAKETAIAKKKTATKKTAASEGRGRA